MNYQLIKDYEKTWHWEFRPGKYKKDDFNGDSVYLNSGAMALIEDCIQRAKWSYFDDPGCLGCYAFPQKRIQLLVRKLKTLAKKSKMGLTVIYEGRLSIKFYDELINDVKKYETEIVTMIEDLIEWLENLKENKLTIIGPYTEFFDACMRPEKFNGGTQIT